MQTDAFAHQYYTSIKKVQFLGNAPFTYVEIQKGIFGGFSYFRGVTQSKDNTENSFFFTNVAAAPKVSGFILKNNESKQYFTLISFKPYCYCCTIFYPLSLTVWPPGPKEEKVFISSLIKPHNNNNTSKKGKVKVYNTNVINIY